MSLLGAGSCEDADTAEVNVLELAERSRAWTRAEAKAGAVLADPGSQTAMPNECRSHVC